MEKSTDKRVRKAAQMLADAPNLKVPEAMRAAKYTLDQSKSRALQMQVRRYYKKNFASTIPTAVSPPASSILEAISPLSASATSSSAGSSSKSARRIGHNVAGVKDIRKTAKQSQQRRLNSKKVNDNEKRAHKKATLIYDRERKKKGGMGAPAVVKAVNQEMGANLSARTIRRYVQEGKAGESPMKRGTSDDGFSHETFKLLLNAFESYVHVDIRKVCANEAT